MPAGDGTGPSGMGPRTGRGAGLCSGFDAPGWANPTSGRGLGRGWWGGGYGRGRGGGGFPAGGWRHRNRFYATGVPGWAWTPSAYGPYEVPPTPEGEVEFLRRQAEWLQQELDGIGRRIEELEKDE
jgi:hypothetical protein